MGHRVVVGRQECVSVRTGLENALAGYCTPNQYVEAEILRPVSDFLCLLHDARLLLDDMRDVMASISGRLTADLERPTARALTSYKLKIIGFMANQMLSFVGVRDEVQPGRVLPQCGAPQGPVPARSGR